MDNIEARRYINVIRRATDLLEGMLDNDDDGLLEQLAREPQTQTQPIPQQPISQQPQIHPPGAVPMIPLMEQKVVESKPVQRTPERKHHVDELMKIDCWPEAVMPYIAEAVATEDDQIKRGNSVLDTMLTSPVSGKSFLDYGCGEGWITQQAIKRGVSEAVGYDIKKYSEWETKEGVFTDNFGDLSGKKFDFIMLYDVLDHSHNPEEIMMNVKNHLNPDGDVYIRCHPWTSLHASHVYKKGMNKAFIHLFLGPDELEKLIGEEPMFTRPEKSPIEAYHWWFKDFEIKKERKLEGLVSDFFYVPAFKELLANEQGIPKDKIDDFMKLMEIQFVDYHLRMK